jgi:transposase
VEFKELAEKRVKSGQSIGAVAKELGLIDQTLRIWVKAAKTAKLHAPGPRRSREQMELSRVRVENAWLRRKTTLPA